MATPTIQGTPIRTGYASVASPATGNVATSGTLVAGDVIACWIRVGAVAPTWTVPTNWVNPLGGTTLVASSDSSEIFIYHVVTSTEQTANTVAWTFTNIFSTSQTGATYTMAVRGANPSAPIDVTGTSFDTSNSTTEVLAAVTPTKTNSLILAGVGNDATSTYATAPTGWTFQVKGAGGQNGGAVLSFNTASVAGTAVGPTNITASASTQYAAITVAFAAVPTTQPFFAMF